MRDVSQLLRKGIVDLRVPPNVTSVESLKVKYGLEEVIKLSGNTNPLGPSPKVAECLKSTAEALHLYPDQSAITLRHAIAEIHGLDVNHVVPGNGSSELIQYIGQAFINDGDACVIPDGSFRAFHKISTLMGSELISSPLKEFRIDLEEMAKRITPATKLIIMANPNNPTGDIVRSGEIETFLNRVGEDIIVVFDEAYAEFVDDHEFPAIVEYIKKGRRVIILRTLSKAYGLAGARLGYLLSTPEIVKFINAVRCRFNVNAVAQLAGVAAIDDQKHVEKSAKLVWEEKPYCYGEFQKMNLPYIKSYANFICVNVGVDDLYLRDVMMRKGVIITPLTPWGFKGFLRISIGTRYENEKMIECLRASIQETLTEGKAL